MRKINILLNLLQGFGTSTWNLQKGNKSKCAKRNKNRECEGVGPFKEINIEIKKLINN